ncbi:MAG: T9SS type A sorting domain-containing protein [Ignavibacteria bacterium]|nr:T9SS type A sorting domain-containing protein [Ignavibacteria bacterium]
MKRCLILITLFSIILNSNLYSQNWYTFAGNNQKNGVTKMSGPISVSTPYWTVTSTNFSYWGNAVYTFGDKFVTARVSLSPYKGIVELRSLTTGELIWQKTVNDSARMYVVGFTEDAVYAHDYLGMKLYALNISDGSIKWSISANMFPGNTGICFAPDGDPIIFQKRLDRKTGTPKWTNNYVIPVSPDGGYVVYNNTYYHWTGAIGSPIKLIAIDINTGLTKYMTNALPGAGDQENDLVVGPDGTIYIARDGGSLHAFIDNGTGFVQKWALTPAVLVKSIGPNNVLYCANVNNGVFSGKLMRVNGMNGIVIDSVSDNIPAGYVTVDNDSTVYVNTVEAANGRYFAFTPDLQTIKWQLNIPYTYYSGCPIGKEGVFITIGNGYQITAYKPNINRKPVADFRVSSRDIFTGDSVNFYDQSSYSPTSWQWTFTGATPSSSTLQNPTGIKYLNTGVYEVKLVVSNSYGSDTLIKSSYIFVTQSSAIKENKNENPNTYKLYQNYPNPFNVFTVITYELPKSALVELIVFDVTGKLIKSLVNGYQTSGKYNYTFDASELSSGVYFYQLSINNGLDYKEIRKMIFIK